MTGHGSCRTSSGEVAHKGCSNVERNNDEDKKAAGLAASLASRSAKNSHLAATEKSRQSRGRRSPSGAAEGAIDRTALPIAEPDYPARTVLDARDTTARPASRSRRPRGAPNVLIVLVDDMGFGMPSAFGGPVRMPTAERLAKNGLRYNQFHTTALCSPTRTALLSGRNHHIEQHGRHHRDRHRLPRQHRARPNNVAPLAEMLRLNGTARPSSARTTRRPRGRSAPPGRPIAGPRAAGFDKFYGFIGGETDQWAPAIYDGMTRVEPPHDPGYNFMTDMTDQAIAWTKFQKSLTPDKPFFMYFAPGATHAPHHVPKEWIDKYKGRFDGGWDKMREATLARQIEAGRRAQGHQAGRQAQGHQGLGQAERRRAEALCPPDGSLRRLRRVHRPRDRPAVPAIGTSASSTTR